MVESQIPAVARFFFLTLPNQDKMHEGIYRTILRLNKIYKEDPSKEEDGSLLVFWTYFYWKRMQNDKRMLSFLRPQKPPEGLKFVVPESIDLSLWQQLLRESKEEEALFLIWSHVMNISDHNIAKGMGLSDGTVRFRIGNALKKLGKIVED
tara:strand:+ start:9887 stop:10339 length:453 start_codon:yes stop_codon:yes gene_type:complete